VRPSLDRGSRRPDSQLSSPENGIHGDEYSINAKTMVGPFADIRLNTRGQTTPRICRDLPGGWDDILGQKTVKTVIVVRFNIPLQGGAGRDCMVARR
jgi:hypothetical protein